MSEHATVVEAWVSEYTRVRRDGDRNESGAVLRWVRSCGRLGPGVPLSCGEREAHVQRHTS